MTNQGDLVSRESLKEVITANHYLLSARNNSIDYGMFTTGIMQAIDNAPTVESEDLKPLVDKVLEVLPELTDAIIKELPKIVSGKIKCSECSYYTNTFNGEWVRKEDLIQYIATQYIEHNELVPIWLRIGDMKGGANNG